MTRAESKIKREQIANYIHSLDRDYTYDEITKLFKVSKTTVQNAVYEYGVKGPKRTHKKPMSDRDREMAKRYENGEAMQSIADTYNVTRQRVYQILLRLGKVNHDRVNKLHAVRNIPFVGLRNYLIENGINCAEFSYKLSEKLNVSITPTKITSMFVRYNCLSFDTIKAILDITGLTFEECFALDNRESR